MTKIGAFGFMTVWTPTASTPRSESCVMAWARGGAPRRYVQDRRGGRTRAHIATAWGRIEDEPRTARILGVDGQQVKVWP